MADTWIAFYGVKFEIPEDDDLALNDPEHPFIMQVIELGLDWSDLLFPDEQQPGELTVVLMVGRLIGTFGQEAMFGLDISEDELMNIAQDVKAKLQRLQIDLAPRLYLVFQPEDF